MTDHIRHRNRKSIYLLDAQHQKIKTEAKTQGMSFSAYVVECALSKRAPDSETKQILMKLYLELGRIGNNLNQIARSFNQDDPDYQGLTDELPVVMALLKEARQEVMQDDY